MVLFNWSITVSGARNDQCSVDEDGVCEVKGSRNTLSIVKIHKAHLGGNSLAVTEKDKLFMNAVNKKLAS